MKIDFTDRVLDALEDAPLAVRKAFRKQLIYLAENLHHPSLRAKKYDETRALWQARVTRDWRFYFKIVDDTYRLEDVKKHPREIARRRSVFGSVASWAPSLTCSLPGNFKRGIRRALAALGRCAGLRWAMLCPEKGRLALEPAKPSPLAYRLCDLLSK